MPSEPIDYKARFATAAITAKWAVTMTKVYIRKSVTPTPFPRWHFVSFMGVDGKESRGVVDLIAIRKNHAQPINGNLKRGDALQIVLIQVKGGYAARPTLEDGERLRAVAKLHKAHGILLASWKRGAAVKFYALSPKAKSRSDDWVEVSDLATVFC